jgi:ATP-dependent helicase HrpB
METKGCSITLVDTSIALPISPHLDSILAELLAQRRLVLNAEPGAGKSTAVPLALLKADVFTESLIIMLEPRRVAATSLAYYLASQLGETVGEQVGYHIRHESKRSAQTRLLIVTEGMLTRMLQNDPELDGVGCIIFDEFHERSVPADLGLMLGYEVQQSLRDDLHILVMSASMDTPKVAQYLGNAPTISVPGRTFPVAIEYCDGFSLNMPHYQRQAALSKVLQRVMTTQDEGDVLVFLPGQRDIQLALEWCKAHMPEVPVFGFYGAQALAEQSEVLARKEGPTAIIFATNIAETSLTLPRVTTVIDSGFEKRAEYDVKSGATRLTTARIAQASAIQRAGRAGRVQAGRCVRLWSESQVLAAFAPLPITQTDLADTLLECAIWGMTDWTTIPWIDPPPQAHIEQAKEMLVELGLWQEQRVTELGKQVNKMGISVRSAVMLLSAHNTQTCAAALALACLLGERDILVGTAQVDMHLRVVAFLSAFYQQSKTAFMQLHRRTITHAIKTARSLQRHLSHTNFNDVIPSPYDLFSIAFKGMPERLAKWTGKGYTLANGRGVILHDSDPLYGEPWLLVLDFDAQQQGGRIYLAMAVEGSWIQQCATLTERISTEYDVQKKTFKVYIQQCYRALVVTQQRVTTLSEAQSIDVLKQAIAKHGLTVLRFDEACQAWCKRLTWLAGHCPDRLPDVSEVALMADLDTWFVPYCAGKHLAQMQNMPLLPLLQAYLDYEQTQWLARHAPEQYRSPTGKTFVIRYGVGQPPTVSLPLQMVFGELTSPLLAEQQVPLRFELLSPAQRPIQMTADLAAFWQSSYHDVAKDMRGRYPKHRWPEDPLSESAGHSLKSRGQG